MTVTRRLIRTMAATGVVLGVLASSASAAVNFEPFRSFPASQPDHAAAGDLNNDGRIDMISASSFEISTLIGNGDGTLQAAQNTPGAGGSITALAAGDVTGDGRADVVTSAFGADRAWVYPGKGDGTFEAAGGFITGTNPQDVVLADLDGDNDLDMITADLGSQQASVFRNDGSGNFTAAPPVTTVGTQPSDIAVADFNRDGNNDLAISAKSAANEGISIALGNGNGTFVAPSASNPATSIPVTDPEHLVAADFNADGRPDLATARRDVGDVVVVARNAANDGWEAPVSEAVGPGPGQPERLATADLDGDGDPELAVPHTAGRVVILIGGAGSDFGIGTQEPAPEPHEVAVADLNRDGNPDLATASSGGTRNEVSVLLATPPTASVTPSLAFGDQAQNVESAPRTVVVRNNGAPRLKPGAFALGGANPEQFRIVSNGCAGVNLAIGQECGIAVAFRPTGLGGRNAALVIASNAGGAPHTIPLTGTGVTPVTGPLVGTCVNMQNGSGAAETLTGTVEGDNLFGFGGNDVLNGLAGDDCLTGGDGNDRLNGGEGRDTIEGNNGNDTASGGTGNDRISGGAGRDRLSAGTGNDSVNGGSGNDSLSGSSGNDTMNGSTGNDTVSGSSGNDRLSGSTGNDRISGGSGKNSYSGGSGNDTINARNRRNEVIDCGTGRDRVTADRRDRVKRCERVSRR